jgi:hypothetical protein
MSKVAVKGFWSEFQKNADALLRSHTANTDVYDHLLEQLQKIDDGLFLTFSAEPGNAELILTAEGDAELFDLVESIVQDAPDIPGWKIFALKPKLGFPETARWDDYEVRIEDVLFEPLQSEGGELGLLLLIPGLTPEQQDDAHNALLRAIDHGLGERKFAEAISHTEVAALEGPADEFIPLVDLEKFIEWRQRKQNG